MLTIDDETVQTNENENNKTSLKKRSSLLLNDSKQSEQLTDEQIKTKSMKFHTTFKKLSRTVSLAFLFVWLGSEFNNFFNHVFNNKKALTHEHYR